MMFPGHIERFGIYQCGQVYKDDSGLWVLDKIKLGEGGRIELWLESMRGPEPISEFRRIHDISEFTQYSLDTKQSLYKKIAEA